MRGTSVVTAIAANDIHSLFQPPKNESCKIAGWYLSTLNSDEQINQFDSTAARMMQTGREIGMDDLLVDTAMGFERLTLNFRLWTYLRSVSLPTQWKNPNPVSISLELTCSEETLESFWLPFKDGGHPNMVSANLTAVQMIYPRSLTQTKSIIELEKMLSLKSTYAGCNVEFIRAFADPEYTQVAADGETILVKNSSEMNPITGLISPVIEVTYDQNTRMLPPLYLQASKVLNSTTNFNKNHIISFEFCRE